MGKLKKFLFFFLFLTAQTSSAEEYPDENYNYIYEDSSKCNEVYDPYEKLNRKIFFFNSVLDYFILRPIAITYRTTTNDYTKARVSSFVTNFSTPYYMVNYMAQGNFGGAARSFWRFTINSTLGIAGLFDLAAKMGIEARKSTFGDTLASYGVPPGPYLVLPFIGGTTGRDFLDPIIISSAANPLGYSFHRDVKLTVSLVKLVSERSDLLPFTDEIAKNSLDPYIAIRTAIYGNRESYVTYPKSFICPKVVYKKDSGSQNN